MSHAFNWARVAVWVLLLALAPAGRLAGGQQVNTLASKIDVEALGPTVGDVLPEFNLPDQTGQRRTLKSLLGANGAVIVFFRSADW